MKGLEFSLTEADLVIPTHCPILGIELAYNFGKGRALANSFSLDRIDNTKGYVPGNVAVISWRANMIKSSGTAEEHRRIAAWMDAQGSR